MMMHNSRNVSGTLSQVFRGAGPSLLQQCFSGLYFTPEGVRWTGSALLQQSVSGLSRKVCPVLLDDEGRPLHNGDFGKFCWT
mmetsp:Transcript_5601/g.12179  ORF Transcript_5601/g.12179 Transcript_5601/m.12179 type:complete len:82 (+) Transcript_5601:583-828(+)